MPKSDITQPAALPAGIYQRFGNWHELLPVWRAAVEATHHFLSVKDIDFYKEVVIRFLPELGVWVFSQPPGTTVQGFMGLNNNKVEMLFVDPAFHGRGVGSALLEFARRLYGPLSVDVNQQNQGAHAFYLKMGFQELGRSDLDGSGRPFPIIHMRQPADPSDQGPL